MEKLTGLASVLCLTLLACAPAMDEDFAHSDKEDSFAIPSEHGALRFGPANPGEFTDLMNFHSWTFALTDNADIEILTDAGTNLDTVMYLYRRDPGASSWGGNIAKNDDYADSVGSRIQLRLAEPGEYRVKLKAAKIPFRGHFDLMATCDGAGCPKAPTPTDPATLPANGITEECSSDFLSVITSETKIVGSRMELTFPDPDMSSLNEAEKNALGHYVDYWDAFVGFHDVFGATPTVSLSVRTTTTGIIASVDVPSDDESGMTLVYDEVGRIIMLVQHNQSEDAQWYCDTSVGSPTDEPEIECSMHLVNSLQRDRESTSQYFDSMAHLGTLNLDDDVVRALEVIEDQHAPDPNADFTMYVTTWDNIGVGTAVAYDGDFGLGTLYIDGSAELLAEVDEEGIVFFYCEGA